ncbi:MAG: metallophosphoesterase [bacterium]
MVLRMVGWALMFGLLGVLLWALLRFLNPVWWRLRTVRRATLLLPITAVVLSGLMMLGYRLGLPGVFYVSSTLGAVAMVAIVCLVFALPVSGLVHFGLGRLRGGPETRAASAAAPAPGTRRRDLLKLLPAAIPALAVTTGSVGVARAFQKTRVHRRRMTFAGLPKPLHGLRILHISDSHLGVYRNLDDFGAMIDAARPHAPDLVVLTGDIADALELLPGALRRAAGLRPRLGCFACLGNHEYFRGVDQVLRIHARGPVRLLRSMGVGLTVGGVPLWIGGVDDPRRMHGDNSGFLHRSVRQALRGAPPKGFRILLSHRPEGFVAAASEGVHLTLAGHTHGGQLGLAGRSLWQSFKPDSYLWGEYRRGPSKLFVSAGDGHWFPFRLGCPPEAPVIELHPGPAPR